MFPIPGNDSPALFFRPMLDLGSVQSAEAGDYTVTVSNPSGSVTSATATLTVNAAPTNPGSGGGGGGGALSGWFAGLLAAALMARQAALRRRRPLPDPDSR